MLFTSHISTGVGLPISSFLLLLLDNFGLQLQHLTPHSLLLTSIFVHLCEMFVGVRPCVILFHYLFILVKSGRANDEVIMGVGGGDHPFLAPILPLPASEAGDVGRLQVAP